MMDDVKIEQLGISNKWELIKLFIQAFKEYPFIPIQRLVPQTSQKLEEASIRLSEVSLKFVTDFYMSMKSCFAYGVRMENKLVCAFIAVDSTEKPSLISFMRLIPFLIRFNFYLFRLARIIGRRTAKDLGNFFKEHFTKRNQNMMINTSSLYFSEHYQHIKDKD